VLRRLDKEAREATKGLWVDPAPIPPWVSRKARRGHSLDISDAAPLESHIEESTSSRGPPQFGSAQSESVPDSKSARDPVIGNRRSHIYHCPDCTYYSEVAPYNPVAFNREVEGEVVGYRLAGNCL